ncbi:enoyl-CoA hydratase-related protein [Celeribacter baekdonensis]|uniref:3-hydroxyacyl-CoA dehydrogenase n=1 Tax=Celeribacter baekdonensis B30 TaxID=1208323 RepID=K2JUC1_9RHOB|nr:enoyl-CoA hydratase-related protein [Celeribacter baekdonensis]EKE68785.1 3-hydroxyacyl-CoA dehydrogenase [Celeribacter baekdonensis B30]|tara:strand:- start:24009 stop:26093 length:2085 start_codon:yes stop_codon:yes gene_type:complete
MRVGQNVTAAQGETPEQDLVQSSREGALAVLRLSRPPVNTLTDALRLALFKAIEDADNDSGVRAIVVAGEGASFCTGYAPDALSLTEAAPTLNTLCDRIEACGKPVVAALHGATLEAGLALALAAHYRVMGRAARLGAPEVSFGLVPGGGVTQRLPRLIGADAALALLLPGRPIDGAQAQKLGLIDQLVQKKVGDEALAFARHLIESKKGPRPSRDTTRGLADGARYMSEVAARRMEIRGARIEAPKHIIDCVEAALMMPFDAGVWREQTAREDCFASAQSKALRHAYAAERQAARLTGVDGVEPAEVITLGIVGTGTLALGIAVAALDHGFHVRLLGNGADQLVVVQNRIEAAYTRAAQQGQISPDLRDARVAAFTTSARVDSLAAADLVIEATQGNAAARGSLLARVEEFLPEEVVLATVADRGFDEMARDLAHPERFLGLHFFAPAQMIRVVELAHSDDVSPKALVTAHAFLCRLGKIPVTVSATDGLIANVVQEAGWAAVDVLLLMGARPAQIDQAMREYGFPAGPCEAMDALGLGYMTGAVAQYLAGKGRAGKAKGAGFYDYVDGAGPDDSAAEALLAELRADGGIAALALSDTDIVERLILAEANAGARLLERGVVSRPLDIDVVMMIAKGYPRWRGGPMESADAMGIVAAEKRLLAFAKAAPDIWEPATLWRALFKNGACFEKLNRI